MPNSAAVRIGNAIRTRTLVNNMFQVKMGIRNIVIPGPRRQMIVVITFIAARMVPRPETIRPLTHRSPPSPGECSALCSGA